METPRPMRLVESPLDAELIRSLTEELGDPDLARETAEELRVELSFSGPTPAPASEPLRVLEGQRESGLPVHQRAIGRLVTSRTGAA